MAYGYANEQQAGFNNYVQNVAIVGVSGRSGKFIANALIEGKRHRVTAITRLDSTNTVPSGLHDVKKVDYVDHVSLVNVLKGHDMLIITMATTAPQESQIQLIDAAIEAGVQWIMPNEWGIDLAHEGMAQDSFMGSRYFPVREHIQKKQTGFRQTHFISLSSGFWYEFSLAGTEARFGFDFDKKTLTLYNDGTTKINTSTWPLVGEAVARLLSLKIMPADKNDTGGPCLSQYNDQTVYVSSFFVSQRDMFESVLRVTGDKREDWTITHEDVVDRYHRGLKLMQEGHMVGFGILAYARNFYADGAGDVSGKLANDVLRLPKESLDDATGVAVKMAAAGETNTIH